MGFLHEQEKALIKGGYYMEVSVSDGKKVLLLVVDDCDAEEGNEHDDIGLNRFGFFK